MIKKYVTEIISSWFYTGYSPVAPGTCGTAGAVLFYLLFLRNLGSLSYMVTVAVVVVTAVTVSTYISRRTGEDDPSHIVVDEVAGYLVTMAFIPPDIKYVVAGFVLFRVFDIVKPFPAGRLEQLHGGYGIVLDDVAAGVWSNIFLHIIYLYIY